MLVHGAKVSCFGSRILHQNLEKIILVFWVLIMSIPQDFSKEIIVDLGPEHRFINFCEAG